MTNELTKLHGHYISDHVRDAAREIKSLRAMVTQAARFAEARIMELLWEVRQELPEDRIFGEFVNFETNIEPDLALSMASTWDTVRKNRSLREFAQRKPGDTILLVQQLAEAGVDTSDETDADVAQVLSLPSRKRRDVLRDLISRGNAVADGHHPADQEEIRTLKAERDAAIDKLYESTRFERSPSTEVINLTRSMSEQVRIVTIKVTSALDQQAHALDQLALDNLMHDCEAIINCAETIMSKSIEGDDAEDEDG